MRGQNGEAGDRDSEFDPEGDQLALLSAVLKATAGSRTKVVVVLIHGRPVIFGGNAGDRVLLGGDGVPGIDALLSAWRPESRQVVFVNNATKSHFELATSNVSTIPTHLEGSPSQV